MTFWQAYARFWTQAFNLDDRARKLEFWAPIIVHVGIFVLAYTTLLITLLWSIFFGPGFGPGLNDTGNSNTAVPLEIILLPVVIQLLFVIPNFSLLFRRLQDLNISGWWALVPSVLFCICDCMTELTDNSFTDSFATIIYILCYSTILIASSLRGTKGTNKYGPDPYTGVYSDRTYQ